MNNDRYFTFLMYSFWPWGHCQLVQLLLEDLIILNQALGRRSETISTPTVQLALATGGPLTFAILYWNCMLTVLGWHSGRGCWYVNSHQQLHGMAVDSFRVLLLQPL
ncbi:MAG: hypothetical protein MJE68_22695 [Proteobacteria bacterium]|nr:hypothetical protein [Pseudomonadota bacterium]